MGPYHVTVTGTKFRMAFHAGDQSLRVSTEEGQRGGRGRMPGRLPGRSPRERASSHPARPPRRRRRKTFRRGEEPPVPAVDLAPPVRTSPAERWRELLAAGRLREGLRAAERANFDRGLSDRDRERAAGARGRRPVLRTVPACGRRAQRVAPPVSRLDGRRNGRLHAGADRLRERARLRAGGRAGSRPICASSRPDL